MAHQDLQIALWYSFACNNLDEYEYYYRATQWMPDSEQNAKGCGTWYYRYSVALMYCGQAGRGHGNMRRQGRTWRSRAIPGSGCRLAKLRSHFGNRGGALRGGAVAAWRWSRVTMNSRRWAGRFRRVHLWRQMEYHWIDPDCDQALQDGLDEGADDKRRAISCIVLDPESLKWVKELLPADGLGCGCALLQFSYAGSGISAWKWCS